MKNERDITKYCFDTTVRLDDPYEDLVNMRKMSKEIFDKQSTEEEQKKITEILGHSVDLLTTRKLRAVFMSSAQSAKSRSGQNLENYVALLLTHYKVKYYTQKHDGICGDFIIPKDDKYIILSTKTVLKERWKEFVEEKTEGVSKVYVLTLDKITPTVKNRLNSHGILILEENISFKSFIFLVKGENMNTIDLFCGAGGMSIGFEKAGFKSIFGMDNNQKAIETYKCNRPNVEVICDNIKAVSANDLEAKIQGQHVNIIIGGPPCTAFSMAGKRDPNDVRASLFMDFIRMVNFFKPQVAVMENVPGILTAKMANGDAVIDAIISEYLSIGYKVCYKKLNSADFGVPQKRVRVIFVCIRNDIKKTYTFPEPSYINKHIPVSSVLEKEVDSKYTLSDKMIEGFEKRKLKNKENGKGFGFQVLDLNKPSYTVSARYYKDGADALVQLGEKSYRKLTELEVARIQTFPEEYKFAGSSSEIYTQLGNAVPCVLAEVIATSIKSFLEDVPLTYKVSKTVDKVEFKLDYSSLFSHSLPELKSLCISKNLKGYSKYKKAELIDFIAKKLSIEKTS